jgi:hypothetical protein
MSVLFRGYLLRFLVFLIIFLVPDFVYAQSANEAVITGVSSGCVGYVTYSTTTNGINAQIGRWDTPYPHPGTGEPAPGLEPDGYSCFYISVAVNDGGLASFNYRLRTYDAGNWDWYDIRLETPTGTVILLDRLAKPGSQYGTYWESSSIALSQGLNQWRNQSVRFLFAVHQDGWGDQTVGDVISFDLRTCEVPPLTPIVDQAARVFENGQTLDTTHLVQPVQTALACLQNALAIAGKTLVLSSAYRPPAYQLHLQEVWDRWDDLDSRREPECQELRNEVGAEFRRHGLLATQRPAGPTGPHTQGRAIDVNLTQTGLPVQELVNIAEGCGLYRPYAQRDPVHFQHR